MKIDHALVSILIPVYNRVNLIEETVISALSQDYQDIEIIIVDNCSTDGTWQLLKSIVRRDQRIKIFKNNKNLGPVLNWKKCLDKANGFYSKLLFSDDKIDSTFISKSIKLFNDDVAFIISSVYVFSEKLKKLGDYYSKNEYSINEYIEDVLLINKFNFPVSPGCALFRTDDLKKSIELNLSNPLKIDFNSTGAGVDLLLFLNTALRYSKVRVNQASNSYFRSHNGSITISNKLLIHYHYAKYYFIKENGINYLKEFKTVTFLKKIRHEELNEVYNLIDIGISYAYFIKATIHYMLKILNKRI